MNAIRGDDPSAEPGGRAPIAGALAELVDLERRLETRIREAEAEAGRIVTEARHRARSVERDDAGSYEDAVAALRRSIDEACAAEIRAIGEGAEAEAARYRDVDDATLSRLAEWVARRVLSGADPA